MRLAADPVAAATDQEVEVGTLGRPAARGRRRGWPSRGSVPRRRPRPSAKARGPPTLGRAGRRRGAGPARRARPGLRLAVGPTDRQPLTRATRAGRPCRTPSRSSVRRRSARCRARPAPGASSAAAGSRPRASPGSPWVRTRAGTSTLSASTSRSGSSMRGGGPRRCRRRQPALGAAGGAAEAAAGLMTAPSGARLPRRTAMPASARSGSTAGRMTVSSQIRRVVQMVDQRAAGDGDRRGVEQVPRPRGARRAGRQPGGSPP